MDQLVLQFKQEIWLLNVNMCKERGSQMSSVLLIMQVAQLIKLEMNVRKEKLFALYTLIIQIVHYHQPQELLLNVYGLDRLALQLKQEIWLQTVDMFKY